MELFTYVAYDVARTLSWAVPVALAVWLVWIVFDIPDFAIGDFAVLSLFLSLAVFDSGLVVIFMAIIINGCFRLVYYFLILRPYRDRNLRRAHGLALALGVSLVIVATTGIALGNTPRTIPTPVQSEVVLGNAQFAPGGVYAIASGFCVVVFTALVLHVSSWGRIIPLFYANLRLARVCGLESKRVEMAVALFSSLLAVVGIANYATVQEIGPHDAAGVTGTGVCLALLSGCRMRHLIAAAGLFSAVAYVTGQWSKIDLAAPTGLLALAAVLVVMAPRLETQRT